MGLWNYVCSGRLAHLRSTFRRPACVALFIVALGVASVVPIASITFVFIGMRVSRCNGVFGVARRRRRQASLSCAGRFQRLCLGALVVALRLWATIVVRGPTLWPMSCFAVTGSVGCPRRPLIPPKSESGDCHIDCGAVGACHAERGVVGCYWSEPLCPASGAVPE